MFFSSLFDLKTLEPPPISIFKDLTPEFYLLNSHFFKKHEQLAGRKFEDYGVLLDVTSKSSLMSNCGKCQSESGANRGDLFHHAADNIMIN